MDAHEISVKDVLGTLGYGLCTACPDRKSFCGYANVYGRICLLGTTHGQAVFSDFPHMEKLMLLMVLCRCCGGPDSFHLQRCVLN